MGLEGLRLQGFKFREFRFMVFGGLEGLRLQV